MSLRKKIFSVAEWVIALILIYTCINYYIVSQASFTAIDAFRASEKSFHYGPSEIKKEINFKNKKVYLAKYKDWISAASVEKRYLKWYPGNGIGGFPIDYSAKITQTWTAEKKADKPYSYTVFGYVNDANITTVNFQFQRQNKERSMKYNIDSDKMFIFYWEDNEAKSNFISLSGVDKEGKVIYEYKYQ